jgi:hypothetical protein
MRKKEIFFYLQLSSDPACWCSVDQTGDELACSCLVILNSFHQCCGSLTFWYGSLPLTDLDPAPDPAIFVSDIQDGKFFAYYFLKLHLHHFSKIKSHKEVTKR